MLVLVGIAVWWSIQREHVFGACCAAWSLIVATSRTSVESLWVMWWRRSAVCLV